MSTSVAGVTTNFFPDAENGFTTTTAGSVASGATTVTLASVAGYTNGMPVVFVIDPSDVTKKQTFTGVIDTAGVQVTSVVWTAGTNQTHALGATVVDYPTATHMAMISKGLTTSALDQDGTLKAGAVDVAGVLASDVVTTAKILNANVTTAKIADANVTGAKMAASAGIVNKQLNTTNSALANSTIQTGVGGVVNGITVTVTFPVAFATVPIVVASGSGGNSGANTFAYPPANSSYNDRVFAVSAQTTTTFLVTISGAATSASQIAEFTWIAVGS